MVFRSMVGGPEAIWCGNSNVSRKKMIKNPLKQIFKNPNFIAKKLNLNLNSRPQNLSPLKYFEITKELEDQSVN